MPLSIQQQITKCKTVGRCGTGQVKAIFLHEDGRDIASIIADERACCASNRGCKSSYHYVLDPVSCRIWRFVQEADTAWAFNWDDPLNPFQCNPCPDPINPTCDPCTLLSTDPILVGEPVGSDPNCFAIHIAIAIGSGQIPGFTQTPLCPPEDFTGDECPPNPCLNDCSYNALVTLLQEIHVRFPLLPIVANTSLRRAGCDLACIDLVALAADVNTPVVPVVPFNRLCADINLFPVGVPTSFVGIDADGLCVRGVGGAAPPPSLIEVCAALSAALTGPPLVLGTSEVLGDDCLYHVVPLPTAPELVPIIGALAVGAASAGPFLGTDGQFHSLVIAADVFCTALNAIAPGVSAVGDTFIAMNGGVCKQIELPSAAIANFRVVQALVAGNNVIVHGLGLTAPFTSITDVRDDVTGALITANVTNETANSLTVNVSGPVAAARISIVA